MKKLKVSAFVEDGVMSIRINDDMILPGEGGKTEIKLASGRSHYLNWYVEGKAFGKFRIALSLPTKNQFELNKPLDGQGQDFGFFHFKI